MSARAKAYWTPERRAEASARVKAAAERGRAESERWRERRAAQDAEVSAELRRWRELAAQPAALGLSVGEWVIWGEAMDLAEDAFGPVEEPREADDDRTKLRRLRMELLCSLSSKLCSKARAEM